MRLGLSVSPTAVHAILVHRGVILWIGSADYESPADLAETIAQLAAEAPRPVRRARVVLERALVQHRTLVPAPPIKARAAARYVALEAPRLFRMNGTPHVTDAVLVSLDRTTKALRAAAAPEPLVRAALAGCAEAGLRVDAIGPAGDVLPRSLGNGAKGDVVMPGGELLEIGERGVVRSRLVRGGGGGQGKGWVSVLESLGDRAAEYAAAYGAAVAMPQLALVPTDLRVAHARFVRRRAIRVALLGAALWVVAAGVYLGRLSSTIHGSTSFLEAAGPSVDTAVSLRRELAEARSALALFQGVEGRRSRHLTLLGELTRVLGDSVHLVALRVGADGTVRLAGYAPVAARVLAAVERMEGLREPRFEGPVAREARAGRELDRFAIVGTWGIP